MDMSRLLSSGTGQFPGVAPMVPASRREQQANIHGPRRAGATSASHTGTVRAEKVIVYRRSPARHRRDVRVATWGGGLCLAATSVPLYAHAWALSGLCGVFVALFFGSLLRLAFSWTMTSAEGMTWSRLFWRPRFVDWSEITSITDVVVTDRYGLRYRAVQIDTGGRRLLRPPVPRIPVGRDPEFDRTVQQLRTTWKRNLTRRDQEARAAGSRRSG